MPDAYHGRHPRRASIDVKKLEDVLAVIQVVRMWSTGGIQEIGRLLWWLVLALVFWSPF